MRKGIAFALGAALVAPVMWATPAQAQSARSIQRLEERVQEAKNRGDWGRVQQLEQQLNMDRLQYQRRNGMGENYENPRYQNGYYQNGYNRGYYNNNPYSNRQRIYDGNGRIYQGHYYPQNRGVQYDPWGFQYRY